MLFAFLTTLLASAPALAVYSPELGRFRTRDPAGYVDGSNLHEYGRANPIRYADALGLKVTVVDPTLRKRTEQAMKELCPGADISIDENGNVSFSCANDTDALGCKCLDKAVNGDTHYKIDSDTNYLNQERQRRRKIIEEEDPDPMLKMNPGLIDSKINTWLTLDGIMPGPQYNFNTNTVYLPGSETYYRPVDGAVEGEKVKFNDTIALAHELCVHGVDGIRHPPSHNEDMTPNPSHYGPDDPTIMRENEYRKELGEEYGQRGGRRP
jgi:uncharacterized protein RhaS with RHS repeats